MIRLGLIRHGHTAWNRAGQIQGRTDIPLDNEAVSGLQNLCLPNQWKDAALMASPLSRASQTAFLISGKKPQTDDALIEMNWGDWEGKKGLALKADPNTNFKDIEHWGWDYRPPNGESPREVWSRLEPFIQTLSRDTIAVCHIGIMRIILAKAHKWNFSGPPPFTIKRNRIYQVDVRQNQLIVSHQEPIRLIPKKIGDPS